jgi:hypothetical protein
MKFIHPGDSHRHSLEVLNQLYEYDDFMASIKTVLDLGCGQGDDLEWWATRTTRDDNPEPMVVTKTNQIFLLVSISYIITYCLTN